MNARMVVTRVEADNAHSGQQVAFSPTLSSLVQVGDHGKLRWSKLHYSADDIGNSMREGTVKSAALARPDRAGLSY